MTSEVAPGIDGVIVINMDRRPDRWEAFQKAWRDLLPWDRVHRLSASDGVLLPGYGEPPWFRGRRRDRTWAGRGGCTLSHARALREARARGWSRVLIMEDDALPAVSGSSLPAALSSDDWGLFYLGGREPFGPFQEAGEGGGVVGIMGALDTHAYAVSSEVRDWMIAQLPDETTVWPWIARERAIDRWMRREIGRRFRVLICRPQFAVQADDVSDITERRDGAYGSADVINLAAAHRPASELRRGLEIMTDGLHAELKRVTGF